MTQPFEILDIPASGAYGTLCLCRQDGRDIPVAVKVLNASYDVDVLKRFRDEARILHRLDHPNIVRVSNCFEIRGRTVVVMEFIQGRTLEDLVRRNPHGLPASVALDVTRQAADALDCAYNAPVGPTQRPLKIIHRDIKPANLLLKNDGILKVVDFGVARGDFEDREAETQSMVMGSLGYTAPERLDAVPDSPAVDIYALGVSLVLFLTGKSLVLPRFPTTHDARRDAQLAMFQVENVDNIALKELLSAMTSAFRDNRPTAAEVSQRLRAMMPESPEVGAWCLANIQPTAPPSRDALEKLPAWDQVAFLEETMDGIPDLLLEGTRPPPAKPWWKFW